jgi:hypothetical protein
MTPTLTRQTIHQVLLKSCLGDRLSESDALLWMVLLHTHTIHVRADAIAGANAIPPSFPALTQRGAAEIVARVWSEMKPQQVERANYVYWYQQFNTQTPYEVIEDVPEALLPRLVELRDTLMRDSRVASVEAED